MTRSLQFPQRTQASRTLQLPAWITQVEMLTESIRKLRAILDILTLQRGLDRLNGRRLLQRSLDLVLRVHAATVNGRRANVQWLTMGQGQG